MWYIKKGKKYMRHYKVAIYFDEHLEKMVINANSKAEAFFILARVYRKKLESKEVAIIIRDLTHEELKIYKIEE